MFEDPVVDQDVRRLAGSHPQTFRRLDGMRILLTGATGFVGSWLLRSLLGAATELGIDVEVHALTRDSARFAGRSPELARHRAVRLVEADIRRPLPALPAVDLVVHAAAETNVDLSDPPPAAYFETGIAGTMHVAAAAAQAGAQRLLFTSSGAVYGAGAFVEGPAAETDPAAPLPTDRRRAYGNAKRAAEAYLCAAAPEAGIAPVVARLFAFVGPDLPLDSGYAVGNFIRDALRGGPIVISGDGTPLRSYLYAADMALWLWTLAVEGTGGEAYNVGSERAVSIAELAREVSDVCGGVEVEIARSAPPGVRANRYVPSTAAAREAFGLTEETPLRDALSRTVAWCRSDPRRYR